MSCRICNGPVDDAKGYRKLHGVWICAQCCRDIGGEQVSLVRSGMNPIAVGRSLLDAAGISVSAERCTEDPDQERRLK